MFTFRMIVLAGTILVLGECREVSAEGPVRVLITDKPAKTGTDPLARYLNKWRTMHRGVASSNPFPPDPKGTELLAQTKTEVTAKSFGCVKCHWNTRDMHTTGTVQLGCVDCHGGDPTEEKDKHRAHVLPRFPEAWPSSANPVRSYTLLNRESPEFIRFVNPGDLRIAHDTCGRCHPNELLQVKKSMMTNGCMLWGAALYNNGVYPAKHARFGESYSMNGVPQRIFTVPPPTDKEILEKGVLPFLDPLPRFEVSQPGNILRYFERGGRFRTEIGIPERLEEPGRPRERLSIRGPGTMNRTDPVFIGLQKTRLLDPTLNFLGTNDHPGDYRSSGCTACHVIYANDRSKVHSGPFSRFGNRGLSFSGDPSIPRDEPGHPISHKFTVGIPTSQCIVCHVHPGTNVLNSYLGFMWWDNETDGELMYPEKQKNPTAEEVVQAWMSNPEEASLRGKWSDPEFLNNVTDLNDRLQHTQFADFHGHGWVFRAVFKKDRKGNLLDHLGQVASRDNASLQRAMEPPTDEERKHGKQRAGTPVHLMDIHLEKGMHCVDCHFSVDSHGNTKLYGEVRAAIEIRCIDCHGSTTQSVVDQVALSVVDGRQRMPTTGPAAPIGGTNLLGKRTPFGRPRFEVVNGLLIQHSMVEEGLYWIVVQTADTMNPDSDHYNVKSHMAKTVRFGDGGAITWGGDASDPRCAHQASSMSCIACHSSWNTSCFGCHLPQRANAKMPDLHNEGSLSRNYTSYNFQTLRDDVYMLGRDGNVTGNRIGPVRSACAIHVTSYNAKRESIYGQQQTVSSGGMSGIAFSSNVPHTVRGGPGFQSGLVTAGTHETKMCTDCHLSTQNDNNALMAQLLMQGTNYTNFIGKYCWIATGHHGLEAIAVTEDGEPQAVIGSSLHRLAYPDNYREHLDHDLLLQHAHKHPGWDIWDQLIHPHQQPNILDVQARGEYLYAACGSGGIRIFDIAFIDDKAFSERITTAPVSPQGQKFYVPTRYATAIAAPATIVPDPTRHQPEINDEKTIPLMYAFIYATDKYEGLVSVFARTLLDGNPLNNFLDKDSYLEQQELPPVVRYNPGGLLDGALNLTITGHYAYICCDRGLVIVDIEDPFKPRLVRVVSSGLASPRAVEVQFRYAFVCDLDGIKVLDVTDLENPRHVANVPMREAKSIYVARTYAYVAAGSGGLKILDVTNPERPVLDQVFTAGGVINDLHDVKLGITNVSEFAYLADGRNGLRVVQLTSAETPGNDGFSPRPIPQLVATYELPRGSKALAVSEGIDRDRAVDESGNQIAVFGRVGAGPLNLEEQQKMYLKNGSVWKVNDNPFDTRTYRFSDEILRRAFRSDPATTLQR